MKQQIKVIKLNRRYKLYKEHGMEHAIRFNSWDKKVGEVESFMRKNYGSEWVWGNNSRTQWKTHWGKPTGNNPRPYFIGVRDEEMLFVLRLAGVI